MNAPTLEFNRLASRPLWKSSNTKPIRDGLCNVPVNMPELCRTALDEAKSEFAEAESIHGLAVSRNVLKLVSTGIGLRFIAPNSFNKFMDGLKHEQDGTVFEEVAFQIELKLKQIKNAAGSAFLGLITGASLVLSVATGTDQPDMRKPPGTSRIVQGVKFNRRQEAA